MECKCGYRGIAEIGQFKGLRHGQERELPYRCPKCKSLDFRWINEIDSVRLALIQPDGRNIVNLLTGGADPSFVGYSIFDPTTHYGRGGTISLEEYKALKEELKQLKLERITFAV